MDGSGFGSWKTRRPKKHINFFNISFLAPAQNTPFWAPRKSLCASFPGKGRKRGTHKNFFEEILGSKTGSQTAHFRLRKVEFIVFFLSLKTVPAVLVPLSVSGKTVPTVLVSGSGSVPEPP